MKDEDFKDFNDYINELKKESDRGLILVGTSFIDQKLKKSLEAFCINHKSSERLISDRNAPLGTFSSRVDACLSLGLIDEFEHSEISLLRKIRNEFAHGLHGLDYGNKKVEGLISSLKSDLPIVEKNQKFENRFKIINSLVCLITKLYYRPEYVISEKRTIKNWAGDIGKWIPVEKEQPKEGEVVLAITQKKNK